MSPRAIKAKPWRRPVRELLERHIERIPEAGCWIWTGSIGTNGYGRFQHPSTSYSAHRACYEEYKGRVPNGLVLDHLCKEKTCVNPDHLQPVTQKVNVQRGWWGQRTACSKGHTYLLGTYAVYTNVLGVRYRLCRICANSAQRMFRKANRERINAARRNRRKEQSV